METTQKGEQELFSTQQNRRINGFSEVTPANTGESRGGEEQQHSQQGGREETGVNPWTCVRAEFRIMTPDKQGKQRRRHLQRMKGNCFGRTQFHTVCPDSLGK